MAITTGLKKKLSITVCDVSSGSPVVDSSKSFEVMINPAGYKHQFTISYNKKKTLGQSAAGPKFNAACPEKLALDNLVLDSTGVVELVGMRSVSDMVEDLLQIVYRYNSSTHEPNHVQLLWGSLIFIGRLESISVDYTMFKPSGEPLRAKVSMSFSSWVSDSESSLRANRNSPDLSHLVEVAMGDTLPLLCNRIYKDPSYYREVARINNLTNFRNLQPGQILRFPPLV